MASSTSWLERFRQRAFRAFATVGMVTVGGVVLARVAIGSKAEKAKRIPESTLIHLDLSNPIVETAPNPLSLLFSQGHRPIALRALTDALRKAASDDRVKGIVCTFGAGSVPNMAVAQEIRQALLDFRSTQKNETPAYKKFVWVAADTFGEAGQGSIQYYLASACDKIFLQSSGLLGLIGFSMQNFFLKTMLDKIGVKAELFHYFEYKNAANMFTQSGFTDAHKEQSEKLVDSLFRQIVEGVAQGRNLPESKVISLINKAPLNASTALKEGLVDSILYPDQVVALAKESGATNIVSIHKYIKAMQRQEQPSMIKAGADSKPRIALITATGNIVRGLGDQTAREAEMGGDTVAAALRKAYNDPVVKAVVVRVDSRGGSAVASDTIRRELAKAKETGRPVVVSMGGYAASGGYYIATGADKIVAQPGTITGSIGVIYGKFVIQEALDRLGIASDDVRRGEDAASGSMTRPFTKEQAAKAQQLGMDCYEDFTGHVARSRGLTTAQVDKIARGRVWTGVDAHRLGLVDQLGGLRDAHALATTLAGLPVGPGDELPPLVDYPKKLSVAEKLIQSMAEDKGEGLSAGLGGTATVGATAGPLGVLWEWAAARSGMGDVGRVLEWVGRAGAKAREAEMMSQGVSMMSDRGPRAH